MNAKQCKAKGGTFHKGKCIKGWKEIKNTGTEIVYSQKNSPDLIFTRKRSIGWVYGFKGKYSKSEFVEGISNKKKEAVNKLIKYMEKNPTQPGKRKDFNI